MNLTTHKLRRETATPKLTTVVGKFIPSVIAGVVLGFLALRGCDAALKKQAELDYQQCLAWQDEGYKIRCDESKYQ